MHDQLQFWKMTKAHFSKWRAEWDKGMETCYPKCSLNPDHETAAWHPLGSLKVIIETDSPTHVMWSWQSECLLHDMTREMFEQEGFTGFETLPVKTRLRIRDGELGKELPPGEHLLEVQEPKIWQLVVTGWAGIASPECGVKVIEHCRSCGRKIYCGVTDLAKFEESVQRQWDGSDFFMVWPLPRFVFVSERVVKFVKARRLKGVKFLPPSELNMTPDTTYGASHLSNYMPDARAREIGLPLGIY